MRKRPIHIRKVLTALGWLFAGMLLIVLLAAAIRESREALCKGTHIEIKGSKQFQFLDPADIGKILGNGNIAAFKGKPVSAINLSSMEGLLEKNKWISNAELYIDQEEVLQVEIVEPMPIARVFTGSGNSFYLDSAGKYLPLAPGKPAVRLPVFTGMPERLKPAAMADSALLAAVKAISKLLQADSFWMAQIAQINLGADGNFEMVPLIGDHRILFGNGSDCADKFRRLTLFYKKVLTKTGFDYYKAINVGFAEQVIGIKDSTISTSVDKKMGWRNFADSSLRVVDASQNLAVTAFPESQPERTTGKIPIPAKNRQPKAVMKKNR